MAVNVGVRTAPGRDGTVVILAAWCATCRDEAMPDRHGQCGFCGRLIVDEDLLLAKDAIASTNTIPIGGTMTVTASAVVCKIDGCENEAPARGRYSGVCHDHRGTTTTASRSSAGGGGGLGLADHARRLVPLARKLEKARAQLEGLPSTAAAKAAFDEATRRASQNPSGENLDRVQDTLRQLQTFAPKKTRLESDAARAERALELELQSFTKVVRQAA